MKTRTLDSSLIQRLSDDRARRCFGRPFAIKLEILASMTTGRPLASIAQEYQVSPQAVSKLAAKVRRIYAGETTFS